MSIHCGICGYLSEDCVCEVKLVLVDGATMTYDRRGVLVALTNNDGSVEDPQGYSLGNGCPDIRGLWHDEDKVTIDWEDVLELIETDEDQIARFVHAPSILYLDNGQVVSEGQVIDILVDGVSIISNGGCDTSGFDGDNNVYCQACDTQYEVKVDLDDYKPHWCCFCGSTDLLIKGEN